MVNKCTYVKDASGSTSQSNSLAISTPDKPHTVQFTKQLFYYFQPDTVPQGVVDMNKCTDVKDASGSTSHSNSLAISTPDKTTYIKGQSKEEIQWCVHVQTNGT